MRICLIALCSCSIKAERNPLKKGLEVIPNSTCNLLVLLIGSPGPDWLISMFKIILYSFDDFQRRKIKFHIVSVPDILTLVVHIGLIKSINSRNFTGTRWLQDWIQLAWDCLCRFQLLLTEHHQVLKTML